MIQDAKFFLDSQTELRPRVGLVLGSGLGAFADEVKHRVAIPFAEIPGWPHSTAVGHAGKLVIGKIGQLDVAVMAGRVHLYEGYSAAQVVFGVRVLGAFGVKSLVLTNAAGGIREDLGRGGMVLISDHINLQGVNPLTGPNDDAAGPRFPDMTEAYSKRFREIARSAGLEMGVDLPEGVYAAMPGPSYETPAEIHYLRTIGADLVGMSTVLEAIAANHMGMQVLGISCVTNLAAGLSGEKLSHQEVLETGETIRGSLAQLLRAVLPRLDA
ncbi:MAG: purine-nucleoside phosphorylase [Acidobacteriota bacterium]|nr:purine-nucleoside phosphorylase [Acidobacteriota bacterium]